MARSSATVSPCVEQSRQKLTYLVSSSVELNMLVHLRINKAILESLHSSNILISGTHKSKDQSNHHQHDDTLNNNYPF